MIPKNIFQTYTDFLNLNPKIKSSINEMRANNPNYTYTFFDDRDQLEFIHRYYPEKLRFYNLIRPEYGAARADYFRYLLIQKFGGIYLDIKSGFHGQFDKLIHEDDQFLLSYWNMSQYPKVGQHRRYGVVNEYQNWHIISVEQNPILASVIEEVESRIIAYSPFKHGVGQQAVLRTTGPIAYSKGIYSVSEIYPHRIFDSYKAGLIYNLLEANDHHAIFKKHYSLLQIPLIYKSKTQDHFVAFIFRILDSVKQVLKKLVLRQRFFC